MNHHRMVLGVARVAAASVGMIAIVEWILALARPEGGPLGVVQIIAPHLAIAGLVAIPFAVVDRRLAGRVVSLTLLAVTILRFGGDWFSLPPSPVAVAGIRIEVVTWNLQVLARPGATSAALLVATPADVIGLQELQPDAAAAIDADPVLRARYPYRVLVPREDVRGLGLLSRFPIADPAFALSPAVQQATLDLGGDRMLAIINAHPFHADIAMAGDSSMPIGLDVRNRNADLVAIRTMLDTRIAAGLPALLLGDLNTAPSEPAFDRLVRDLHDVHAEVGQGTGWTWRPIRLEFLGLGMLRIDHVIGSRDVIPVGIGGRCPAAGDHCLVHAVVSVSGE